jgi:hypothetical protein
MFGLVLFAGILLLLHDAAIASRIAIAATKVVPSGEK